MDDIVPRMHLRNEIHLMMKEICQADSGSFEDIDTYWMETLCDSQCYNEPERVEEVVGEVFINQQEAEAFNEVMAAFFSIHVRYSQTEEYMADPLWPKLAEAARKMFSIMDANNNTIKNT